MRVLLGLIAVVLLLAVCGWITFGWNGDRASVNVETEKIEEDTRHIVKEGRDLVEGVSQQDAGEPTIPQRDEEEALEAPADANDVDELERRE